LINAQGDEQGSEKFIKELPQALNIITKAIHERKQVLIHCSSGENRGPTLLAFWILSCLRRDDLKLENQLDLIHRFLKSRRKVVNIDSWTFKLLKNEGEKFLGSSLFINRLEKIKNLEKR
jgi:protein-tyrosine phosphatase